MLRSFIFILFPLLLFSCKSLVEKFDDRLKKNYLKKGFIEKTIDEDGLQIHYFDNQLEDKPVILFIHGFGGDGKISWWQQAKELHKDYRVIIPDILWFGNSYSKETPSLSAQIEMVNQLIELERLNQVHLVGISYGGFISLGTAKKYGEKLASLTIVDSPGAVMTNDEIKAFCQRVGAESVEEAFIPENEEEVKRLMNFSFEKPPKLTSGIRKELIGLYFSKYPEEQRQLLGELPNNRAWVSGEISVPALIMWGKEDQVFLVDEAKELKEMLNAELVIIPDAGHALPEEKPKSFNKNLVRFISSQVD